MPDVIDQAVAFLRAYYAEQGIVIRSAHVHAAVANYLGFNSKIALKSDHDFDPYDQNLIAYRKTTLELLHQHIPKMKPTPLQSLDVAELGLFIRAGLMPPCQACAVRSPTVRHFAGDADHPHGWLCHECSDGFDINFSFKWLEHVPAFPERVAHVKISVTPPRDLPEEVLQRMVFVLPEFFETPPDGYESEPMRVDSAHFYRVTEVDKVVDRRGGQRHVLSYHLVQNAWLGTVFHYRGTVDHRQYEAKIQAKIRENIIGTVVRYLAGSLPNSRLLSKEIHRHYVDSLPTHIPEI
ncbi:hypothetical protein [Pseudomonas corrugata]|uniref:hypothetical protein n=1 Tax=Pseudomonas corrugata TaxID=47879 RepID=UPI001586D49C|nr:hypothetical protein [Pseudomonas corrugata]MCI0992270.1 hypothetical protein [Pseudomonas corrugata]NUT65901.1 hypothetical protein [Pseudomonas corrugata]